MYNYSSRQKTNGQKALSRPFITNHLQSPEIQTDPLPPVAHTMFQHTSRQADHTADRYPTPDNFSKRSQTKLLREGEGGNRNWFAIIKPPMLKSGSCIHTHTHRHTRVERDHLMRCRIDTWPDTPAYRDRIPHHMAPMRVLYVHLGIFMRRLVNCPCSAYKSVGLNSYTSFTHSHAPSWQFSSPDGSFGINMVINICHGSLLWLIRLCQLFGQRRDSRNCTRRQSSFFK